MIAIEDTLLKNMHLKFRVWLVVDIVIGLIEMDNLRGKIIRVKIK